MFEGDLIHQLKLWGAVGVLGVLPGTFFFGLILKHICKLYPKVILPYGRAIYIQFIAMLTVWLIMPALIMINQLGGNRLFWLSFNGILAIFITAFIYSKMIGHTESDPIGYVAGLRLSALMTLIAVVLKIPVNILQKIITNR